MRPWPEMRAAEERGEITTQLGVAVNVVKTMFCSSKASSRGESHYVTSADTFFPHDIILGEG